jgi:hypothetical protein
MQPIHLSYTPDRADFAALYALERTPAVLRTIFFAGVVGMSMGLGWLSENSPLFAALTAWSPPWGEVATVAVMVAVMYGVLIALRRLSDVVRAARAAADAGRVTADADSDGVSLSEAGRLDVYLWAEVLAVRLGRDHVFLSVPGNRRIGVPRRAFADGAAMTAFARAAAERVRIESGREDEAASPAATPETAR